MDTLIKIINIASEISLPTIISFSALTISILSYRHSYKSSKADIASNVLSLAFSTIAEVDKAKSRIAAGQKERSDAKVDETDPTIIEINNLENEILEMVEDLKEEMNLIIKSHKSLHKKDEIQIQRLNLRAQYINRKYEELHKN